MKLDERIAVFEAENRQLRHALDAALAQNVLLVERVQELEAHLAKDGPNSGKPASSGGLARRTKSQRKRSGKKPGGRLGHRGKILRRGATPDAIVEHRPTVCAACQHPLDAAAPVLLREHRPVHDLPVVRLVVTEHQTLYVQCPRCRRRASSGTAAVRRSSSRRVSCIGASMW